MASVGSNNTAAEVLIVEVSRGWRVGRPWQVQIRRRDNDRVVQRLACASDTEAENLAQRAQQDLALPLDAYCHTYLITRADVR